MKRILSLIIALMLLGATPALAQYTSPTTPYSAPQVPNASLLINKMVLNPQTNQYVDNLSVDQFQFLPNQEVDFKIIIKNTSQNQLTNIKVTDTLPSQLQFLSGPLTFDSSTNTYFYMINSLNPGDSTETTFKTKVKDASSFPSSVFCMTNLSQATTGNILEQDTSSICASKNVLGVTQQLPKTGPGDELLLISIGASLLALLIKPKILKGGE